jgi:hypothetical protein
LRHTKQNHLLLIMPIIEGCFETYKFMLIIISKTILYIEKLLSFLIKMDDVCLIKLALT